MRNLSYLLLILLIIAKLPVMPAKAQLPASADAIRDIDWSPDGSYMAIARNNGQVEVLDAYTQQLVIVLAPAGENVSYTVAWSPDDSNRIAAGVGELIYIWHLNGMLIHGIEGHSDRITSVAWSNDASKLASTDAFGFPNIRVWDASTGLLIVDAAMTAAYAIDWSPDDSRVVVAGEQIIDIFTAIDGAFLNSIYLDAIPMQITWHPFNKALVAAATITGKVYLVDIETGQLLESQSGHSDWIFGLAWHPSGNMLASASRDGNLYFWNSALVAVNVMQTGDPLYAVAWSPDGTKLAYGGDGVNTAIHIIDTVEFYHATPFPSIDPTITPTPS